MYREKKRTVGGTLGISFQRLVEEEKPRRDQTNGNCIVLPRSLVP